MKKLFSALLLSAAALTSHAQQVITANDGSGLINSGQTKLVIRNSYGQSFFTGSQAGSTYSFNQGIFRATTDNPNGWYNFYYDGVTNGVTNFFVRADGQGYFAGSVGVGRWASNLLSNYNGISLSHPTGGGLIDFWQGNNLAGLVWGDGGGIGIRSTMGTGIHYFIQNDELMTFNTFGNLGLGTTTPGFRLEVASGTQGHPAAVFHQSGHQAYGNIMTLMTDDPSSGDDPRMMFAYHNGSKRWSIGGHYMTSLQNSRFSIWEDASDATLFPNGEFGTERFTVLPGGNVGIGTSIPDQKLTVNGTIHATKILVETSVPGPDYVFEKGYRLRSLSEVSAYVAKYKHLPEVASAAEMKEKGVDVNEMNFKLLQKVEELTLYILELKKENIQQLKRIHKLEINHKINPCQR